MRVVIAAALVLLGLFLITTHLGPLGGPRAGFKQDELILNALSYIPDNENSRAIAVVSLYDLASSLLNVEIPDPNVRDAVVDYAFYLKTQGGMERGPLISGLDEAYTITLSVMRENAGYDLRDLSASIWAGLGDEVYSGVIFRAPMPQLRTKLKGSRTWPTPLEETVMGAPVLRWGEELQVDAVQQFNPPVYNQRGQPARFAFTKQGLLSALRSSEIDQMLSAHTGQQPSLGDSSIYQQLAQGANAVKIYSMVLSSRTQSLADAASYLRRITVIDEEYESKLVDLQAEPMLKPYQAFATGIGKDELGRFYMGLVLTHENAALAEENLALLQTRFSGEGVTSWKKPWNELFSLELAEFAVDGNNLLAKVPFAENRSSNIWRDWFYSQDYLLLHE